MDNTKIKAGAILYLPVFHEGALLAMGDVHACMGDGEIMVTGAGDSGRGNRDPGGFKGHFHR